MKKTINAVGMVCPRPVMMAKKALEEYNGYDKLEVVVDNKAASLNVMKFARSKGLKSSINEGEHEFVVEILLSDRQQSDIQEENGLTKAVSFAEASAVDTVIAIGSEGMGEGDNKLGELLINSFLYSLTQLDSLPKAILFYNGGARLTSAGTECIEDLKTLEQEGVEILTCGTCMKFYEIEDKLAVGSITNMYDIAQRLMNAGKVIKL